MRTVRRLATVPAALLALAAPAAAQPEAGPALRGDIKAWLAEAVLAPLAEAGFDVDAAIDVTAADDGYRLTVAGLTVTAPAGSVFAAGTFEATVVPRPDGRYAVTARLPSQVAVSAADGRERLSATIGGQRVAGTFAPALQAFTALDIRLDDLRIDVPPSGPLLAIGHLGVESETIPAAAGTHDMVATLAAENIAVMPANAESRLTVARAAVGTTLAAVDLDAYAAFASAYGAVLAEGRAGAAAPDPDAVAAKLAQLIEATPPLLDGIAVTYDVSELTAETPDGAVGIARSRVALSAESLAGDAATLHARAALSGIAADPPPEADILPREAALDVTVSGVPNAALTALLADRLRSGVRAGPAAPPPPVWDELVAALGDAGATVRLDRLSVDAGVAAVAIAGTVHPAAAAARGAVASLSIRIRGFDRALEEVRRLPDAAPLTLVLTVLRLAGAAETDAEGRPTIRYDLDLTADGRTIVNGVDLAPLLGTVPETSPSP